MHVKSFAKLVSSERAAGHEKVSFEWWFLRRSKTKGDPLIYYKLCETNIVFTHSDLFRAINLT